MNETSGNVLTLKSVFDKTLKKYADEVAVVGHDLEFTYSELNEAANSLANWWVDEDISNSDRVALLLNNSVEFVIARLAIIKANAVFVPINPLSSPPEIKNKLEDSGAKVVIIEQKLYDSLITYDNDATKNITVVISGENNVESPNQSLEFILESGKGDLAPSIKSSPSDLAGHHFTGGTTGRPKGVIFTQQARLMNLYAHIAEFGINESDKILLTTPLAHSARLFLKAGLLVGATIHISESFDADLWMEQIESKNITLAFMVPTMIYRILDTNKLKSVKTNSLRTLVYGTAPMSVSRIKEAYEAFGPVLKQMYGQTEVPNLITTLSKQAHERAIKNGNDVVLRSVGSPCLMTQIMIVDVESKNPLPIGQEGEILARSPYAMKEYHRRPKATARTFQEGWVRTGDVGRIDQDGKLFLLDRLDDVIISGGMNIYTVEVENAINSHPSVKNSCVIGIPDEEWGEIAVAVVVSKSKTPDPKALLNYLETEISSYKKPKRFEFTQSLPKTKYGKIDKSQLRETYNNH